MSKDLVHNLKIVKDVVPGAAITTFAAGAAIDTAGTPGFESLTFGLFTGAMVFTATDKLTWTVEESDTTTPADFAAVAADDYLASYRGGTIGWDRVMDLRTDDENQVFAIGIRLNTKRYKRLVPTEGGTVSVVLATWAMLSHPRRMPT